MFGLLCQETLQAFFNNSKGEECIFTWRAIGGGLITLLPAMTYTLRVSTNIIPVVPFCVMPGTSAACWASACHTPK